VSTAHQLLPVVERLDRFGVLALAPEWDHLIVRSSDPPPFLMWPWVAAWLDTLGATADLQVVAARDPVDGRLIGIAPFTVAPLRRHGFRYHALRFIAGAPVGGRHLDLIVDSRHSDAVAPALWEATTRERRWDLIDLAGLAADGVLAGLLHRRRSDSVPTDAVVGHRIVLTEVAGPLGAATPLSCRLVTGSDELDLVISRMAAMVEAVPPKNTSRVPFAHPSVLGFHREAARRLLVAGRLRLWRLDDDHRTVAALLAVRFDDSVAAHTAVAARHRDPAELVGLVAHCALAAADEGAERFLLPPGAAGPDMPIESRLDVHIRRPVGPWGRILWTGRSVRSSILRQRPAPGIH
jgi:hypothetical protein